MNRVQETHLESQVPLKQLNITAYGKKASLKINGII